MSTFRLEIPEIRICAKNEKSALKQVEAYLLVTKKEITLTKIK